MPKIRRTPAQRAQLKTIQEGQTKLADKFAFRMSPHIARWEAEGKTDPQIVDLLNEVGCPVPSEYKGDDYAPEPVKQWSLAQYKRLKERAAAAKVKMAMWAKRHGKPHTRPFGDGAGLFADPYAAGLEFDPNKQRIPLGEMTQAAAMRAGYSYDEWYAAYKADEDARVKVIVARMKEREAAEKAEIERLRADPAYCVELAKHSVESAQNLSQMDYEIWYGLLPIEQRAGVRDPSAHYMCLRLRRQEEWDRDAPSVSIRYDDED